MNIKPLFFKHRITQYNLNEWSLKIAPFVFIFIWSLGYIVAKYAKPYAPPLSFLSIRYVGIAILLGLISYYYKLAIPRGRLLFHTIVVGVIMQAGYLSGVWVGIAQGMPAGMMALIANLQPILTAILTVIWFNNTNNTLNSNNHISKQQWMGLILGLLGVTCVLGTKLFNASYEHITYGAIICAVQALLCITLGTLYQKRFCPNIDPRIGQSIQSIASLIVTVPFAYYYESQPIVWSLPFWMALMTSIVVLSAMGTGLLLWLISRGSATQVTAYLYWVPPISSLLAWLLFNESISIVAWPGFILVAMGVMMVVKSPEKINNK